MAEFLGMPKVQYFDTATGDPLSGGKLYSYESDFITPKATYPTIADALAGTNANTNPVILDARGEANVVISGATGLILKRSDNTTVWTASGPIGSAGADVYDDSGNLLLSFDSADNAVNYIQIANSATLNPVVVRAIGGDSAVDINIESKGTGIASVIGGTVLLDGTNIRFDGIANMLTGQPLRFYNAAGTFYTGLKGSTSLAANITLNLPIADGTQSMGIVTDGAANLSFGYAVPTGAVIPFAMDTAPTGFLVCDGTPVSRTIFANLFAAIGTTFGVGDGSTTFNLPTQARRTVVGKGGSGTGTLANSIGSTGGEETHTLTSGEMPAHTHDVTLFPTTVPLVTSGGTNVASFNVTTTKTTTSTGGGTAHNVMQPSLVLNYCIKT